VARLTMDWHNPDTAPKRGDLLEFPKSQYLVVGVKPVKRRDPNAGLRFTVLAVRLGELEQRTIDVFTRYADRNGGQIIWPCTWNPRKKKSRTFEELMRGGR